MGLTRPVFPPSPAHCVPTPPSQDRAGANLNRCAQRLLPWAQRALAEVLTGGVD